MQVKLRAMEREKNQSQKVITTMKLNKLNPTKAI